MPVELSRETVLAFRQRANGVHVRLPAGPESLCRAAAAGLQDSVPRSAVLSLHARVEGVPPNGWADPALVQLWGPRFTVYVVPAAARAAFSLGRYPLDAAGQRRADDLAARLADYLDGRRMSYDLAGRGLGVTPNALRYAATTGRVLLRWEGARAPVLWTVPPPEVDPLAARVELARRHLHGFGPATADGFADWAGISRRAAAEAYAALAADLVPTRSPLGDGWLLAEDVAALAAGDAPVAPARLLPSGDNYFLLQGAERALLVPEATHRQALWPSRVWPGAVLVEGAVVGIWRRADRLVTVTPWQPLSAAQRAAVEAEAQALPLPGSEYVDVRWR